MVAKLVRPVRDNDGRVHPMGEVVTVRKTQIRVAIHDTIVWADWADGSNGQRAVVLMPDDVEMLY